VDYTTAPILTWMGTDFSSYDGGITYGCNLTETPGVDFIFTTYVIGDDTIPPALVDLSFTPDTINVGGGDQIVTFTWELTDELACVEYATLRLKSPSDGQYRDTHANVSYLISGDMNNGVFESTATFPQYSEVGVWYIEFVYLIDSLNNSQYLYKADLKAIGIATEITVIIQ